MRSSQSNAIAGSVYPRLAQSRKYSASTIDSLLICFRYFKELRNCLMHRGRKCDGKLWGAQSAFVPIANPTALGMDFLPEYQRVSQGDEVSLSLHGVLGFTEVILRIVTTIDAELSATIVGEQVLIERISACIQTPAKQDKLPNLFATIGWPSVILTTALLQLLRKSGSIN